MTRRAVIEIVLIIAVFILSCCWIDRQARAESVTLDQAKEILRLQYTEFCATVRKPPQQLVDAINAAMKEDPNTWLPVVLWFNAISEKYAKAGCGDA